MKYFKNRMVKFFQDNRFLLNILITLSSVGTLSASALMGFLVVPEEVLVLLVLVFFFIGVVSNTVKHEIEDIEDNHDDAERGGSDND